jgi:hypothetical protein
LNGKDGANVSVRGEGAATDSFGPLDIVTRNGHAYICARGNPGVPGKCDDWMLLASRGPQGPTGKAGPMGPQGKTGARGDQIHHWELDPERYRAIPVLSTGERETLDTDRIDDRLKVRHPGVERERVNIPVGHAVASRVVANEGMIAR